MEKKVNELSVNGVTYVPKDSEMAPKTDGMDYCIIRTYSAGVFAGYIESISKDGKQVTLKNSRRIWYWSGACSLSQLAMEGTKKPSECKFAVVVDRMIVTECIEIIYCTAAAKKNLEGVPIWRQ